MAGKGLKQINSSKLYIKFCDFLNFQGCMLVFDVANKASFESLESWLDEFYEHGGKGAVIAVVANKV